MSSRETNFSSSKMGSLVNTTGDVKYKFYKTKKQTRATRSFDNELEAIEFKKNNPDLILEVIDTRTPSSGFYSYVKEKVRETKLKRPITDNINTRPIVWGKVIENYVFNKLGMNYVEMNEKGHLVHPTIKKWVGLPDVMRKDVIGDIKCPSSLNSFCNLIEDMESLETFKANQSDYYWQLVSNAILTDVDKAELIVFVPYKSELKNILEYVDNLDSTQLPKGMTFFQCEFIINQIKYFLDVDLKPSSIPYLMDDGEYKNLNKFEFDIPQEDKDLLTARVELAITELNKLLNK